MRDAIANAIRSLLPSVVELRHALHRRPEIRFEEEQTSARIAAWLDEHGIAYKGGYAGGTGIVAELGHGVGPAVALRADMDALEIQEETGLPYASEIPERMHACGHDGHTSVLCGTAAILKRFEAQLPGKVKLVFQPAEEMAAGGRLLVEEGAIDDVDAVFGLHGWPSLPVGHVGVLPGWMMAGAGDFHMTIRGRGGHGAEPGGAVDPVLVAAHITTALQSVVSRELNPWEAGAVTVACIEAGQATNIIPDTAKLSGTFRSLDEDRHSGMARSIERIARSTAEAFRATAEVHFPPTYPPLCNDPAMTERVRVCAAETLGPDRAVTLEHPSMAAEDFAFYLRRKPGAFFYLGVQAEPGVPYPSLHNSRYDFNDEALEPGMRMMTGLAFGVGS